MHHTFLPEVSMKSLLVQMWKIALITAIGVAGSVTVDLLQVAS
jgi:hypothetical protein